MKKENKRKFYQDEDEKLSELVKTFGISNWITIKRYFNNRTTRQLKDRWRIYLDPQVNQEEWTKEEDQLLIEKQNQFGFSWQTIQQGYFPNRTDISIRNKFVKFQKKNTQYDILTCWFEDFFS
jgi:hypothetical protein